MNDVVGRLCAAEDAPKVGEGEGDGVAEKLGVGRTYPNYEPLFRWVREREAVRVKKDAGLPAPWTDDPVIAKFRFCNVRREDDRVTVWIRKNIRERFADHEYLWLMLCIGRQINWTPTLEEMIRLDAWPISDGDGGFLDHMETVLAARQARGEKVYTGAYTITAPPTKGMQKIPFTCHTVIGQLWRDRERFAAHLASPRKNIQNTHALLKTYTAWGEFMAYQAVGDMIFTPILADAPDRELWCAAGPGTIRGLNRLYGRKLTFALPQEQARSEIRKLYAVIEKETGVHVEFNDVPNCLCETDKYLRVMNGEGEPRALYTPTSHSQDTPDSTVTRK